LTLCCLVCRSGCTRERSVVRAAQKLVVEPGALVPEVPDGDWGWPNPLGHTLSFLGKGMIDFHKQRYVPVLAWQLLEGPHTNNLGRPSRFLPEPLVLAAAGTYAMARCTSRACSSVQLLRCALQAPPAFASAVTEHLNTSVLACCLLCVCRTPACWLCEGTLL